MIVIARVKWSCYCLFVAPVIAEQLVATVIVSVKAMRRALAMGRAIASESIAKP